MGISNKKGHKMKYQIKIIKWNSRKPFTYGQVEDNDLRNAELKAHKFASDNHLISVRFLLIEKLVA